MEVGVGEKSQMTCNERATHWGQLYTTVKLQIEFSGGSSAKLNILQIQIQVLTRFTFS